MPWDEGHASVTDRVAKRASRASRHASPYAPGYRMSGSVGPAVRARPAPGRPLAPARRVGCPGGPRRGRGKARWPLRVDLGGDPRVSGRGTRDPWRGVPRAPPLRWSGPGCGRRSRWRAAGSARGDARALPHAPRLPCRGGPAASGRCGVRGSPPAASSSRPGRWLRRRSMDGARTRIGLSTS